jgi:hypothetical protein
VCDRKDLWIHSQHLMLTKVKVKRPEINDDVIQKDEEM